MEQFGSHWTIFMKYDTNIFRKLSRNFKFHESLTRITGTLHEDLCIFMVSQWILVRMIKCLRQICRENQNTCFMFSTFYPENRTVWDNVGKHGRARQATDDNIIRHMRISCWITKATDTHSEYVILIAFPWQQWLRERAPILRWRVYCLSCYHQQVQRRGNNCASGRFDPTPTGWFPNGPHTRQRRGKKPPHVHLMTVIKQMQVYPEKLRNLVQKVTFNTFIRKITAQHL
jgi:hypothetical protein